MPSERLRALLLVAATGAVVVALRFLPFAAEIGGVVAIAAATALTAPAPSDAAAELRWWRMLGLGTLLTIVGVPLALLLETIGGLLAGAGAALVIVAVVFGWPASRGSA